MYVVSVSCVLLQCVFVSAYQRVPQVVGLPGKVGLLVFDVCIYTVDPLIMGSTHVRIWPKKVEQKQPIYVLCMILSSFFLSPSALNHFFADGERSDMIGPIVERLYYFLHWMEQQKLFKLFATSLIIVYEGDMKRPIRKPKDLLDIRLVDFAHAYERNPQDGVEPDYNTLFGLQNFIKYLEQLNQQR